MQVGLLADAYALTSAGALGMIQHGCSCKDGMSGTGIITLKPEVPVGHTPGAFDALLPGGDAGGSAALGSGGEASGSKRAKQG